MSNLIEENKKLQQRNKELEMIFDSSYDEIFVTDGQGITIQVNSACERNYGIDAKDLIGKTVEELETMGVFDQSVTKKVMDTKQQVTMFQKTSQERFLIVTANPVLSEDGSLQKIICNSKDLTEVKKLKKKLEEMEELVEKYHEEIDELKSERFSGYVFISKPMQHVMDLVAKVSRTDVTVMITGESGVGKTALAKQLHNHSTRQSQPFLTVNCGSLPENLIESELFGYVEGAFTGASKGGKKGLFESADGGTIFLDEISELPLHLQVKLLRVLQEKEITRIGSIKDVPVDVRVIVATNKSLEAMVEEKQFREDLYYRLNVVPIDIPPLRERKDDILPLINHYIDIVENKYDKKVSLSTDAVQHLMNYKWPGNIRELENMMERIIVTASGSEVDVGELPGKITASQQQTVHYDNTDSLKSFLEKQEKALFQDLYKDYPSSYKIAELLNISQSSAIRKIQKHISQK